MKTIQISKIRTDGGTQIRANIDQDCVNDYADALAQLPPIDVFHDGQDYWIADGFHRLAAHEKAGKKRIKCEVTSGGLRDAMLAAIGANVAHGLRRTNADKRHAVTMLLRDEEWSRWSDREVARRAGVSNMTASRIRAELSQSDSSKARKGADGKTRKVPKRKAPKAKISTPDSTDAKKTDDDEPDEDGSIEGMSPDAQAMYLATSCYRKMGAIVDETMAGTPTYHRPKDNHYHKNRRMFREELEKKGVKFDMEPVVYRTDAFPVV